MGFFSINTAKLPKDNDLHIIRDQVWFPDLKSASERSRILNHPGINDRLTRVRSEAEADVEIFQVDKTIKGPHATISSARPGLVARTGENSFSVHLPVQTHIFDIASLAVQDVQFRPEFAREYEEETGEHLGQLAVARAIKMYVNTRASQ